MLSSDKNVETIGQLAESMKHYIGLQSEYVKLDTVEKLVRLLTALAIVLVCMFFLLFVMFCLTVALAHALTPCVGVVGSFCIVAGIYLLLLIVFLLNRRRWVEKPLVRFLAGVLLKE